MHNGEKMVKKPVENSKKKTKEGTEIKVFIEKVENGVNFQFAPFVTCPLPLRPPTKRDIIEGKVKFKENKPEWNKRVGSESISVFIRSKLGYPYGQDNLIILYLIKKALEQNEDGLIEFKNLTDFLKTFEFDTGGKTYKKF